jgi:hypothetical protein
MRELKAVAGSEERHGGEGAANVMRARISAGCGVNPASRGTRVFSAPCFQVVG